MEEIFDNNDVAKSPRVTPRDDEVEECNIGTEADPKIIKISKNFDQRVQGKIHQTLEGIPLCVLLDL